MSPTHPTLLSKTCQRVLVVLCLTLLRAEAAQAPASMIPIWPNGAPGTESWTQKEEWYGDAMDGPVQGLHVRNVTEPGLSVYAARKEIANGTAAIIAPGGGFTSEAWEKEGTLLAEWLQQRGITSFVLKYRLTPQTPGGNAGGRAGGRGAAPALTVPGASPAQQTALTALDQGTATLATAATTARTELARTSLTLPVNSADLRIKAEAVGAAEQALAAARAEGLAKLQAGSDRLSAELVQALQTAQGGGRAGAARGGNATGGINIQALAVADGQQAMRYVRAHAADWGIDPKRLGFVGFSAGGYIAIRLAVEHDAETRPDFVGSVYGCCAGSEVEAPADAPALFLASAFDDGISFAVHAGLLKSWKTVNKPVEIHMYATGGHGFGMAKRGLPNDAWVDRLGEWLRTQKLMNP